MYYLPANLLLLIIAFLVLILILQKKKFSFLPKDENTILSASHRMIEILLEDLDYKAVVQRIANTLPETLKFGTGILAVYDENSKLIRRVAASETREAQAAIKALRVPFNQIVISIDDPYNLMAKALRENRHFVTQDVYDVLGPVLTRAEAKEIQSIMGTRTTFVYPIFMRGKPLGVFIASSKKQFDKFTPSEMKILTDFVDLIGLVLQNSQLYTSINEARNSLLIKNQQITAMNEKLHELDQLKDDFVSVASHELRTPMTAIRSYAWMALYRSDIPLSDKLKKYLNRTFVSTERLINLVNDLLNISRIESGRIEILPEVMDIRALAEEVLIEVGPKAAEKSLNLRIYGSPIPKVYADVDKVHQVLLNLIGNSMKFTPNGGNITISFFSDGHTVDVAVNDTGVGIARDDLYRLFKKFGRLDNSYVAAATSGGTGLGLYISKSLIERMGGRIWVVSSGWGKGSTFTFSLPIASQEVLAHSEKYSNRVAENQVKYLEPVAI